MRRIVAFLLITVIIFNLCGCEKKNAEKVSNNFSKISEQYIAETIISDTKIHDNILLEALISETTYNDNFLYETKVSDDIIAESYLFEITVLSHEMDYILSQLPIEVLEYDIDWESVVEEFAIGTVIIVAVGVMTIASSGASLCYFFADVFFDVIKEALIGAVVGAVVNSISESDNLLDFKQNAKKYIIEGASDGYMWGAVSGVILGMVKKPDIKIPDKVYTQDDALYGFVDSNNQIYDADNQFIGYLLETEDNIYLLDDADNVKGMLDDAARITDDVVDVCDDSIKKIKKHGRYSSNFKVDGDSVISGNVEVGKLNKTTGEIITDDGQLLGRINKNNELVVNNFRAIKKGVVFSRQNKIVSKVVSNEVPDFRKGATKIADYFDADNNPVAYSVKRNYRDGTERIFLMSTDDDSILGILEDSVTIATDWNTQMSQLSANGVKKAQDIIVDMIKNDIDFDFGPSFTDEVITYVKQNGKLPEGLQGHHINNVATCPWLADEPDNIIFYTREDHLNYGHNGNFQNSSQGELTGISKYIQGGME